MSSISTCPHCGRQVLISPDLDPEALVRCPICEAEFPLAQALANAVEAPPELVPVARVNEPLRDSGIGPATPRETAAAEGVQQQKAVSAPASSTHGTPSAAVSDIPTLSHAQAAALWRSRQKPASTLGTMGKAVAITIGGFLGIAVAYFVLSLLSERFDFLRLWGPPGQQNAVTPDSSSKTGGRAGQLSPKSDRDHTAFPDLDKNRSSGPRR